jgi:hypothetical protein
MDNLYDIQMAIALAESKESMIPTKTSNTKTLSEQESAFFTDNRLDNIQQKTLIDPKLNRPVKVITGPSSFSSRLNENSKGPTAATPYSGSKSSTDRSKPGKTSKNSERQQAKDIRANGKSCKTCLRQCTVGAFKKTTDGDIYHPDCFRCFGCNSVIDGPYTKRGEPPEPYHSHCAIELFNPRCSLCDIALDGRHYKHPFFEKEIYCLGHGNQRSCFTCGRKEPCGNSGREAYVELPDRRLICPDCSTSLIMTSSEATEIYSRVVDFMEGSLGLEMPAGMREVPVLAVDLECLNEKSAVQHCCSTGGEGGGIVRGLTLSTCGEIRHYHRGLPNISIQSLSVSMPTALFRVETTRNVTAVLVLSGMPSDLTTSVLAHEAMHVYIKLSHRFSFHLPSKVEEGICQVVAYLYLNNKNEMDMCKGSDILDDQEFIKLQQNELMREYFKYQIAHDQSPIYGDGFREAMKAVEVIGLPNVLDFIRENQCLPV